VQQLFQKYIREISDKEVYVCGWLEIVKAIVKDLESSGVPKAQIHYEEWT
jgi:ferredoxin-NADP reductase